MADEKHIRGSDAARMAVENDKRRPIALEPAPNGSVDSTSESHLLVETDTHSRAPPPRVLKSSRMNDQVLAPTPDLETHRAALRRVFGTLSEEYSAQTRSQHVERCCDGFGGSRLVVRGGRGDLRRIPVGFA
jgi:hypothetical protein